jgi:hypothetical protein
MTEPISYLLNPFILYPTVSRVCREPAKRPNSWRDNGEIVNKGGRFHCRKIMAKGMTLPPLFLAHLATSDCVFRSFRLYLC